VYLELGVVIERGDGAAGSLSLMFGFASAGTGLYENSCY
jgi:hypothetical protein